MADSVDIWPGEFVRLGEQQEVFVRRDRPAEKERSITGPDREPGADSDEDEYLLYVHGLGGSATNWTDLMGELRDDMRGVAVDLPGFGHSPPPADGDYGIDAHAGAVVALIEREGKPAHLVGNSMGAAIATRIAAERPELLRTLTLVCPTLPDLRPRLVPYRLSGALVPFLGRSVYSRVRGSPPEVRVQDMLDTCYYDPTCVPGQRLMEFVSESRERDGLAHADDAALASLRAMVLEYLRRGPRSLWRQAAAVACPTLLVYTRHDKLVDPRMAARAARTFPSNRLVLLAKAGHLPMMERPTAVAQEMRAFVAEADRMLGTVERIP